MKTLTAICSAIAAVFSFCISIFKTKNTPRIQQSKEANQVQAQKNAVAEATEKGDLEQVRNNFGD